MDTPIDPTVVETLFLLTKSEEKFLELGALLRKLQEKSPSAFKALIKVPQLGRRRGYYLVAVDRAFGGYPQLAPRLLAVGWTKLGLVAPFVTKENIDDALLFCELNTAWAIQQAVKGKELPIGSRSVLLHFSPQQFDFFASAILKHGAAKNGDGFVGKEEAIISAFEKAED